MEEFEARPLKTSAFYQFGLTLSQPTKYKTTTGANTQTQHQHNYTWHKQQNKFANTKWRLSEKHTVSVTL